MNGDRLYAPIVPPGPTATATTTLTAPDGRQVPLRATYPTAGTHLPVVVFSHGAYASGEVYDPLAQHWAARGYVVLQPTHPDSVRMGIARGAPTPPGAWDQRIVDLETVIDGLEKVARAVPALAGRMDADRIVAAGHSFGGATAQALVGAPPGHDRPQVIAAMLLSPPGAIQGRLELASWAALTKPLLVTVGTNDIPSFDRSRDWRWHTDAYEDSAPGGKYLLTVRDMDHYGGGMMGPDPQSRFDADALAAMLATTTAFLDAFARSDARARAWLDGDAVARATGDRATLVRR